MPAIIIHTSSKEQTGALTSILEEFRSFAAKELSCNTRALNENEISIRVINSDLGKTIAEIEVVIMAYSYRKRVENQDKICLACKKFLEGKLPSYTIFVWLQLSELGHSLKESAP